MNLLRILENTNGKMVPLVAKGESIADATPGIGNTNSRYRFATGARKFVNEWNSHGSAHH